MNPAENTASATIPVDGELDIDSASRLTDAGLRLLDQEKHHLTLDMSQLRFCDSTGLNAIIRLLKQTTAAGGSLVLMDPPDQVKRLLSMCGLEQIVTHWETTDPGRRGGL